MRYWQKQDVSASFYDTFILDWIPQILSREQPKCEFMNMVKLSMFEFMNMVKVSMFVQTL